MNRAEQSGSSGTNPATGGASEDKSTTILLDAIQDSLDYVGMVAPGVGDALDMVNAAIHVARGNYGTAAVSLAAAVPFLGGAVMMKKLASKGGDVVAKASDDVAGALSGATGKLDEALERCQNLGSCFVAGTQVVVARAAANVELAEVIPGQAHSVPLEVIDEKSLDAYYAAGALALGVGLSFKPRGKSPSKTNRRRRFWI